MKTMKPYLPIILMVCLAVKTFGQEPYYSNKLTKVWETAGGLDVPESACYDAKNNVIYVSNIAGVHNVKDGVGFISKLNANGGFIDKYWVSGLNAPKGMGISNGKLYVTDIDEVVEIDLNTAQILWRYKSPVAKELNDITTDENGVVYVTEMKKPVILKVGVDSLDIFIESDQIADVNGICDYKKELFLGSKGNLIAIDKETKAIRTVATRTGYIDGIVVIGKKSIVISDFKGKIQYINIGKGIQTLQSTAIINVNAADIWYIPQQKLLLVPTFTNNNVIAYRLKL